MKGKTKIILIAVLIVVVVAALAVGGYFAALKIQENKVLARVDDIFTAIKSGDEDAMKEYINMDDAEEQAEDATKDNEAAEDAAESVVDDEEMLKVITQNLNYEVVSKDTKWNDCTVKLKVSNKDFKTVFSGYISKAFALALSSAFSNGKNAEDKIEKELETYFQEQYNSDSVPVVSNEVTLNVKKENGDWKVNYDKTALLNAIMPGYSEVKKSMESFSSAE